MKTRLLIILLFSSTLFYAAGPPNPHCLPFSACWCADKPNHPSCRPNTNVPINGGIEFLALAGLCLVLYHNRVNRKKSKNELEKDISNYELDIELPESLVIDEAAHRMMLDWCKLIREQNKSARIHIGIDLATGEDISVQNEVDERTRYIDENAKEDKTPPRFVKSFNHIAFRYIDEEKAYYRDAGSWYIKDYRVDVAGRMFAISDIESLNDTELIEITEEEWRADNKGYVEHIRFEEDLGVDFDAANIDDLPF